MEDIKGLWSCRQSHEWGDDGMKFRRRYRVLMILTAGCLLCACEKRKPESENMIAENIQKTKDKNQEVRGKWEKGYDLPLEEEEQAEADAECKKMMEQMQSIYKRADKGETSNVVLQDKTMLEMQKVVIETGCPVSMTAAYSDMGNYEKADRFLVDCEKGKRGSVTVYDVRRDGGISRMKFSYDGTDMYVVSTSGVWVEHEKPGIAYTTCTRIKEWKYTENGWFCYKLCVPEPPEVTEIMDGSQMIRIKPRTEEQREMSKLCVQGIGYQGNNLLCSNWNLDNLDALDYNGLYEYLYRMKYGEHFPAEKYPDGIPKDEFESLIMEYLPISVERLQEYAEFDEKTNRYAWMPLGCGNYAPDFSGTSVPEVAAIKENPDGTITLTVNAVCDMVICDDALITHDLTVKFKEDGSFQYLGNEIWKEDRNNIPEYQYRVRGNNWG